MLTETLGEFSKEIILHCPVTGRPKPNITWYKDTTSIGGPGLPGYSVEPESGALTVSYLRAQDSGMYQCWASNPAGEVNAYTWLKVKSKDTCSFIICTMQCVGL